MLIIQNSILGLWHTGKLRDSRIDKASDTSHGISHLQGKEVKCTQSFSRQRTLKGMVAYYPFADVEH